MNLSKLIRYCIEDAERGRRDSALLFACIAVDTTARRLHPNKQNKDRYVRTLREYYWLMQPMLGDVFDLTKQRFPHVTIKNTSDPDLADVIYSAYRCALAHGDPIDSKFELVDSGSPSMSKWMIGSDGTLRMPSQLLWTLMSIAILSRVNTDLSGFTDHFFSLEGEQYRIKDWAGRENDFRAEARKRTRETGTINLDKWPKFLS